jgi:hypothetical protein
LFMEIFGEPIAPPKKRRTKPSEPSAAILPGTQTRWRSKAEL